MALKLSSKPKKEEAPKAPEAPAELAGEDKDTVWIDEVMVRKESFSLDNVNSMFSKVHKYIDDMASQADAHKVIDIPSMEKAIGMGTQAKQYINKIEKTRKEVKQPYLDFGKSLDKLAKGVTKRLESIQESLRVKIRPVMLAEKEKERKAAELAEEQRKEKEKDLTPGFQNAEVPAPLPSAPSAPLSDGVSTKSGSASVVQKVTWEVTDITKVPKEYLTVVASKVNKDAKAGKDIPGIKITREDDIAMRANKS